MSEILTKSVRGFTLIGALGLGAAACGGHTIISHSNHPLVAANTTTTQPKSLKAKNYLPKIEVRFFSNGMREMIFDNIDQTPDGRRTNIDSNGAGSSTDIQNILQWCDGDYLVEETIGSYTSQTGSSITRTPNFNACSNGGVLTPQNYPPSGSEIAIKP